MKKPLLFLLLSIPFLGIGQAEWTLQQCIDYALENNLTLKQTVLAGDISRENFSRSKAVLLPSVNGFASHTYNFGQTIDPFTNQFASSRVQSNNFALQANWVLFNGFQNLNNLKQNQYNYLASMYDIEKMKNDISMNIVVSYMNVLFAEEQLGLSKQQVELSKKQVERTIELVAVGTLAKGELLNVEAQLANDEVNLINAENQLNLAYLDLIQLLQLESGNEFKIASPNFELIEANFESISTTKIYENALVSLPQIKSSENKLVASEKAMQSAKGGFAPRISLNASVGTGYSGLAKEIESITFNGYDTIGFTQTTFESVVTPSYDVVQRNIAFQDQLDNNFNQSIGVTLNLPIFNGWQTKTNYKIAKINTEIRALELQQAKNQLQQDIQKAYNDAMASLKKYKATQKSINASEEAFKYTEIRFQEGLVNAVDYANALNQLNMAKSERLQSKYDFIFKTKILEFYQGKELKF
jgi:outer membrane protein